MMDSHSDTPGFPVVMDAVAHRAFLQEILDILYKAILDQKVL